MRAEVVAVGTELLIGQIVDTNSAWIGEQLALAGIDSTHQVKVGDNVGRIADVLRLALGRADAVIVCGGLGPTHDDVTREAIAEVMGVPLRRDPTALALLEEVFTSRRREMPASNLRQADVPESASLIPQRLGTAPGLICPVGSQVIFAVPGVPYEMKEMLERAVLPELQRRAGETSVIRSRTLRTWGYGESRLAEILEPRLAALETVGVGVPTIAFLASGIEGIKVRLTVKATDEASALAALDAEEAEVRALLGTAVFGVDDETMEHAVGKILLAAGLRLAVAESFTGGLVAARIVAVPGASRWFSGGIVAYDTAVKHHLLEVPPGEVVSAEAAAAMADGARRLLGADVALATTGVAGPDPQEGKPPGTAFAGFALPGEAATAQALELVGGRARVREIGTITALDGLRRRLLARA